MPRKLERGSPMLQLGRVVVHDVEDDLESRLVQELDHALEFAEDRLGTAQAVLERGVRRMRREEVEGVVAPVVHETVLQQPRLGREGVHRQELDARDPQRVEVLDHRRVGEAGIGAAERGGHLRMPLRQALHMSLVEDRAVQRDRGLAHSAPVERLIDDQRPALLGAAADDPLRVGLDEDRLGVEEVPGAEGTVDAHAVGSARTKERRRDRPDVALRPFQGQDDR